MNNIRVGTVVKLTVPLLGNPIGTLGVCFYDYGDGSEIIFENGNYDGFSLDEQQEFLEVVRMEPSLEDYTFRNVIQVTKDFENAVFNKAFKKEE